MDRTARAQEIPELPLPQGGAIPRIGLGTWLLAGRECERVVERAFELGYRHFDTAERYGNEDAIGRAIRHSGLDREELFLTSKAWHDHLRSEDVARACEGSLRRLGVDYLDLYLVHWPNREIPQAGTIPAFQRLQETGQIRAWGVSNFTVRHLEETLRFGTPATNQIELHPRLQQPDLERFCSDHGIPITAYSPLAHGEVVREPMLQEIGRRYDKTAVQVALRWLLQRGHVIIPKARCEAHLESNLEIFDFQLDPADMQAVASLEAGNRHFDPDFAEFEGG
jgi:2,5-diketo-D-gluconate reductase B